MNDQLDSQQHEHGQWTSGLYDCLDDPILCLTTCFFPFITMGRIAEIVDQGQTSCCDAGLIYCAPKCSASRFGKVNRSKLRRLFSLPEEPYTDLTVHSCCCLCSLTQEYRELMNRGFDPSVGWGPNAEKMKNRDGHEVGGPPVTIFKMER